MFKFKRAGDYGVVHNAINAALEADQGRQGTVPADALIDALEAYGLTLTYTDKADA